MQIGEDRAQCKIYDYISEKIPNWIEKSDSLEKSQANLKIR